MFIVLTQVLHLLLFHIFTKLLNSDTINVILTYLTHPCKLQFGQLFISAMQKKFRYKRKLGKITDLFEIPFLMKFVVI